MGKLKQVKDAFEPPPSLEAALELIERLPVPMFVKGRDGRYLAVNHAWEELFGVKRARFLGKTVAELYPDNPEIAEQHARKDRELWQHPGSQSYDLPIVTPDGRRRETIYYKSTFPGGLVGAIFDLTAQKTAERLLRESEERWRATVDSAAEGLLVYDRDLVIVSANRAAERIIGLPVSEMIGKPGFTSLLPCIREDGSPLTPVDRPTRVTVRTGQPVTGRVIGIKRQDGSVTWVSVNTAFLRRIDESDHYGLVSTISDITAQHDAEARLRESERRFRQTFELAASGICHVIDGRFVRVNRSLCEILGYPEEHLLKKSVKEVSYPEDRDVTDAERARIRRGEIESARFEKRYVRGDTGAIVWCDIAIALVRDAQGNPLYEVAIFDDITERKKGEAALRAAHEELKRSNAELEQFASVASHDLQEPLRMVASYTQLLWRRYDSKFDQDAREFMAFIIDGATRMKQLIEDLLAYSRVGTKGADFQPVSAEAALRRALFNLRAAVEEAGAAVTHDVLPSVPADEAQLAQLFQNLIGNALKFRSDSVPRIHIAVAEKAGEWQFEVRDNGIGIEPQYYERIFMVFQRLHNKGEYPGTGIGLAICKKVVERHGGRIWVESRSNQGSSFFFTLPKERRGS